MNHLTESTIPQPAKLTSESLRERQHTAYVRSRAERLSRRVYGVPLEKLTGPEWRSLWERVHADDQAGVL